MKKAICLVLIVIALLITSAQPGFAWEHGGHGHYSFRGGIWIGPGWGPGWGPWWGPPAYPYYWGPPAVTEEQRPAYIQPAPQQDEEYYWYFCPDYKNYYPYVKKCPGGWLKVVPPQTPPDWRE